MKRSAKNSTKLACRRETLRVLASIELAHVVGGGPLLQQNEGNQSHGGDCIAAEYIVGPLRD